MIDLIVLITLLLLLFIHLLYPLALVLLGSLKRPKENLLTKNEEIDSLQLPTISLLISAYNEEDTIQSKIENSIALNYPREKLEIMVTSDASSDRTDEIVRSFKADGVILNRIEGRLGKTACQNKAIEKANGKIIVFSDANSLYEETALIELVKPMIFQGMDCTLGKLKYVRANKKGKNDNEALEEGLFGKFMDTMKKAESNASMPVGANGGIYAVKKSFLTKIPNDSIEDLLRPLLVVKQNGNVSYINTAVANEILEETYDYISYKKQRIAARSTYTLRYIKEILNPFKYGFFSFQVFYKVLLRRIVFPLFLLLYFFSIIGLIMKEESIYLVITLVISVSILLFLINRYFLKNLHLPLFKSLDYYISANYGAFKGLWQGLSGKTFITWNTSRE